MPLHLQNNHLQPLLIQLEPRNLGSNNHLHLDSKPSEYGLVCSGRRLRSSGSFRFPVFGWYELIMIAFINNSKSD